MSARLAASAVVVCVLAWTAAIARAERRPVAVIDVSGDVTTQQVARQLTNELQNHPELRPIIDMTLTGALVGDFDNDDRRAIERAQAARDKAEDFLSRFEFATAGIHASSGHDDLHTVLPTARVVTLYAQLAFIRGQAQLGERKPDDAAAWFALVHRLDPAFAPDPARYLPEVVQAFNAAKPGLPGAGTINITASGRIWLDGREVGVAPGPIAAPAGVHVIWLTGDERLTRGARVTVAASTAATVDIAEAPASDQVRVGRARAALRVAWPDPTARAAAMKKLAELLQVKDAVLLTMSNGKVIAQTWRDASADRLPGFSALRELRPDKPNEVLAILAPPKPKAEPTPQIVIPPITEKPRWYERRVVQVGIGAGVVALVVGSVVLARSLSEGTVMTHPNLGSFPTP